MRQMRGQRWVVTGAAGNIGRALRRYLVTQSVDLVSVDIAETAPVAAADHIVGCDVRDLAGLEEAFTGCSGVVHLGGIPDEADFHDLAAVNIVGVYHVLEAARRAGVGRVVYASSNRVSGFYDVDTLVNESMTPRTDGFYGASKVAGEALCRLYADKFALSTIVVRIGSYEQTPGSPREMHTWLSPADALRAFHAAMMTPEHHITFYAVSNNTERWWDLTSAHTAGFIPVDNATDHSDQAPILRGQPQGGHYAAPQYSLDRMLNNP